MTKLEQRIKKDLKKALKEKKELKTSVLRMLNSSLHNKEIEKKTRLRKSDKEDKDIEKKGQLTEEEIIEIISSEAKKRKEAISQFEKGEREDLAGKERKELKILKEYLPEQFSEKDINKLAREIIEEVNAEGMSDMGAVMGKLMPKVKGKAEGDKVSKIVKELLS